MWQIVQTYFLLIPLLIHKYNISHGMELLKLTIFLYFLWLQQENYDRKLERYQELTHQNSPSINQP